MLQLATKVGKTSAKGYVYPFIRLDSRFSSLIGKSLHIYAAIVDGRPALVAEISGISEGLSCATRPDLGSSLAGVQGFESLPPHSNLEIEARTGSKSCATLTRSRSVAKMVRNPERTDVREMIFGPDTTISIDVNEYASLKNNDMAQVKQEIRELRDLIVAQQPGNGSSSSQARELEFAKDDLDRWVNQRLRDSPKSRDWILKTSDLIWSITEGTISTDTLDSLADYTLSTYRGQSVKKVFMYTRNFLKTMGKSHFDDDRWIKYHTYFEKPKTYEPIELPDPVYTTDIERLIDRFKQRYTDGIIDEDRYYQHAGYLLFVALSGQRGENASLLRVEQFRRALESEHPMVLVGAKQDKNSIEHLAPIHPSIVPLIKRLIADRDPHEPLFNYGAYTRFVSTHSDVALSTGTKFTLKFARKFFQQHADEHNMNDLYRRYVMTHGTSDVEFRHYQNVSRNPGALYDDYMRAFGGLKFNYLI